MKLKKKVNFRLKILFSGKCEEFKKKFNNFDVIMKFITKYEKNNEFTET